MSEADVALVRALQLEGADLVEVFGDDGTWEGFAEASADLFEPDFECLGIGLPGSDMRGVGFEGLREVWREWLSPWRSYRTGTVDVREINGKILVEVEDRAVSHDSDHEVSLQAGAVWTVHDGRVARAEFYTDREAAIRATSA